MPGSLADTTTEASAILCDFISGEKNLEENNNYLAGNTPIDGNQNVEVFGTAVFKDGKLVGELTGFETLLHLIISNKIEECTITIPRSAENETPFDLSISQSKKTKITVNTSNPSPRINVEIFLEGYMLSMKNNDLEKANKFAENFLTQQFEKYLYKTSKEFNSDIDGFGKKAIQHFLTIDSWNSYGWLETYENAEFAVDINVVIKN